MAVSEPLDFSSDRSSPPPAETDLAARLDADIARIKAEVARLEDHKASLKASLLSSTKVQDHIRDLKTSTIGQTAAAQDSPVIHLAAAQAEEQRIHNDVNRHRLAYGITAFPFTDPNPEASGQGNLLGVKFDLVGRNGKFDKGAFYVLLRRIRLRSSNEERGRIYMKIRHSTMPTFIDVEHYASRYLPLPADLEEDDGFDQLDRGEPASKVGATSLQDDTNLGLTNETSNNGQDVHAFVNAVRDDLTAWHYRTEYISNLETTMRTYHNSPHFKHNIKDITQKTADALQIRIIWLDGTIALLRINRDGLVEKAIAVGSGQQRKFDVERLLSSRNGNEKVHLKDLAEQLEKVGGKIAL